MCRCASAQGPARSRSVIVAEHIDTLDPEQLRQTVRALMSEIAFKQATIDKLTHEMAVLKRLKFVAKSEA